MVLRYTNTINTAVLIANVLIWLQPWPAVSFSVVAVFKQKGVNGTVMFTQPFMSSPTTIELSLSGLNQLPNEQYPWHIHDYPISANDFESPCGPSSVGGHYDPFGAAQNPNYSTDCNANNRSACEVGDISGKFGKLLSSTSLLSITDNQLSLHGQYSIIGRSVVIHYNNGSRYVCANIDYPNDDITIGYAPFRGGSIFGDIYIIQYLSNATLVYAKLYNTTAISNGHNWHVHENSLSNDDNNCQSAAGHYDPRGASALDNYTMQCELNQTLCEVGDLSGKGGVIDFANNLGRNLYTDIDLPYIVNEGGESIANRSIVVHAANRGPERIACGNIVGTSARQAIATFNGAKGISGSVTFTQLSPFSMTKVEINLNGLSESLSEYSIHETPIGEGVMDNIKCMDEYTGDVYSPSSNNGDQMRRNITIGSFYDANLPLFGQGSVVGRSIILYNNEGSRWACANIVYDIPTVQVSATLNISGQLVQFDFVQPANDYYADTTIFVKTVPANQQFSSSSTSTIASTMSSTITTTSTVPSTTLTFTTFSTSTSMPSTTLTSAVPSTTSATMVPSTTTSSSFVTSSITQSTITSLLSSMVSNSSMFNTATVESSSMTTLSFTTSMTPFTSSSQSTILTETISPSPSPSDGSGEEPMMRRRRRANDFDDALSDEDIYDIQHEIQKRDTVSIDWSIKQATGGQQMATNCEAFQDFLVPGINSMSQCSSGEQLACSGGDLANKHGQLELDSVTGIRRVFTDPYLPLSGPNSVIGNLLLITNGDSSQYVSINNNPMQQDPVICDVLTTTSSESSSTTTTTIITTSTMSSTIGLPTQTSGSSGLPLPLPMFIAVCAGAGVVLLILVVLIIIMIVCYAKRRQHYDFSDYVKSKTNNVELGMYKRSNPIFGTATYKALYDYNPQQDGDLEINEGDMVELVEAPVGGDWWRGKIGDKDGWFPKTYVKYIDLEAEEKKKKEAEMDRVTAVIRAYTIAGSRISTLNVDSTPITVAKFSSSIKEENETAFVDNSHLPTTPPESNRGTPLPEKRETKNLETSATAAAIVVSATLETPPPSNESLTESPPPVSISSNDQSPSTSPIPIEDIFVAKFDLVPEAESELQLTAGERVVIIERADNGWWHGVIDERHGWIPETYLQPLSDVNEDSKVDISVTTDGDSEESKHQPKGMDEFDATHKGSEEVNVSEYHALASYTSDTEGDLTFNEGDIVLVYWGNDNGWWFGAAGSAQGWFPGSYVEPVLEETSVSPTSLDEIPTDTNNDTPSPTPTDTIITEQPTVEQPAIVVSSGGLADEIAAALKKKQEVKTTIEEPSNQDIDKPTTDTEISIPGSQRRKRADSVDRLGDDIMDMISGMATEDAIVSNSPRTASTAKRPQRKAPPPPGPSRSKSSKAKTKSTKQKPDKTTSNQEALPNTAAAIPVPPPPPPLPGDTSAPKIKQPSSINTPDQPINKNVITEQRPDSPGSVERKRRTPPSPPPQIALQMKPDRTSPVPSPLAIHAVSKPQTTHLKQLESIERASPSLDRKDQAPHSPVITKTSSPVPIVKKKDHAHRTSSWQPQNKNKSTSSGWRPQLKSGNKKDQAAPRREPPKPPPANENSPRVKVQKIKRPGKNIPPPPNVPLPPPPSNKSKKAAGKRSGPPPVKKVLAGPPPVKKVLGGPQSHKRLSKSPSPPPVTEDLTNNNKSNSMPTVEHQSELPKPVVNEDVKKTEPVKMEPHMLPETANDSVTNKESISEADKASSSPLTVKRKPEISPKPKVKPKTKPAVSPKPAKIKHSPPADTKPQTETIPVVSKETPKSPLRSKFRPTPPERTSSLPNTPEASPCPSPAPQPRPTSVEKPVERKSSVPNRPPPPKTTTSTESTDGAKDDIKDDASTKPVPTARKKSNTLPPRPAPPKVATETTSAAPNPKARKVSDARVRVQNLMNPMKALEGRPKGSRRNNSTGDVESTINEETTDNKPVPKRRTSHPSNDPGTNPVKGVPSRPPPPATVKHSDPVPKPRSQKNNPEANGSVSTDGVRDL